MSFQLNKMFIMKQHFQ